MADASDTTTAAVTPHPTPPRGGARAGAGRKKNSDLIDVQALALQETGLAIRTLKKIASKGKSENARIAAAVALLERGHGKAKQPLTGPTGAGPVEIKVTHEVVDPQLPSDGH